MARGSEAAIPESHAGVAYQDFMEALTEKRGPSLYLEIGVQAGELLERIHADVAVGVDPDFVIAANVARHKRQIRLFQQSSDGFFASQSPQTLGGTVDLAFLDGMHTFEFLLRDFANAERLCSVRSLIGMHDCLPLNAEMTHRNMAESIALGVETEHPFFWTGDVWKIVPILQAYRPDLRLVCVDCPPTGIVFVTNLDPGSDVLQRNYLEIVREFRARPNDVAAIAAMYASIALVPAADILNEYDHSLYFST